MKNPTPAQLLEQQNLLDALYVKDGRDNPNHDWHKSYSGLGIKYWADFQALQEDWVNG